MRDICGRGEGDTREICGRYEGDTREIFQTHDAADEEQKPYAAPMPQ